MREQETGSFQSSFDTVSNFVQIWETLACANQFVQKPKHSRLNSRVYEQRKKACVVLHKPQFPVLRQSREKEKEASPQSFGGPSLQSGSLAGGFARLPAGHFLSRTRKWGRLSLQGDAAFRLRVGLSPCKLPRGQELILPLAVVGLRAARRATSIVFLVPCSLWQND